MSCLWRTGGSAGIGRAVALALAAEGVTVTVMARRQERLDAVVSDMSCKVCRIRTILFHIPAHCARHGTLAGAPGCRRQRAELQGLRLPHAFFCRHAFKRSGVTVAMIAHRVARSTWVLSYLSLEVLRKIAVVVMPHGKDCP